MKPTFYISATYNEVIK